MRSLVGSGSLKAYATCSQGNGKSVAEPAKDLHSVASGPVVMLIKMYLRTVAHYIHLSPSVVVFAGSMPVSLVVADSAR